MKFKRVLLRKLLSLFIIIFSLIYYYFNKTTFLLVITAMFILFLTFDLLRFFSKGKNKFAKIFFYLYPKKREELNFIFTDATLFFMSTILMGLFISKEILIFSLSILTFVDAGENIFGKILPFKKLPWNSKKSYLGTFAGFLIGIIISYLAIIFIPYNLPLYLILLSSFVAAMAGTSYKYDNLLIPWSVAVLLTILI